jgi:2-iminobutanoate/2-iminopropanoate deaminase
MFLPASATNMAGEFLFISTIYPIDDSGAPVTSSAISEFVGPSLVEAQSRAVLDELTRLLGDAGSALDRVVRVEVQLASADDFYEFKLVWAEVFGDTPPARTTVVVGDDWVIPGCRLCINAVAIAGDSALQREIIRTDDAPDPMGYEHVSQATKAGSWVFPSALPACDFETGIPVGRRLPRFPYYGSDATAQAHYVLDNVNAVLKAAGTDIANTVKTHLYEPDLLTFAEVDAVWAEKMPRPPTRASMGVRDLVVPGAVFVANLLVVVPDESHEIKETRLGISWHPVDTRKVNFTPGITVGDNWLFLAGQLPVPDYVDGDVDSGPEGMPNYFSDIELQTETTMRLLLNQIDANEYELSDVADARIYLINAQRDYRGFERAWRRIFTSRGVEGDNLPSMSLMPSAQRNGDTGAMFWGPEIEIDLILRRS